VVSENGALVLVVDDERALVELIVGYLEQEGYRVARAHDGRAALDLARRAPPDVVVLDLMLPEIDGLEVCRQLRTFADPYVIMLTARAEEVDKLIGLAVGADDYLTKPFSPRELVARVKALLRRPRAGGATAPPPAPPRQFGDLSIDPDTHEVRRGDELLALTPLEFALVRLLSAHPRRVFTREQLLDQVWGDDYYGDGHVVDVHISNLRHKLEADPANPVYVETVRGAGYRWGPRPA
jgi:DNA-binding response OmpR family regulator